MAGTEKMVRVDRKMDGAKYRAMLKKIPVRFCKRLKSRAEISLSHRATTLKIKRGL